MVVVNCKPFVMKNAIILSQVNLHFVISKMSWAHGTIGINTMQQFIHYKVPAIAYTFPADSMYCTKIACDSGWAIKSQCDSLNVRG